MENKINELIEKYRKMNHNEFDSIQEILSKKEKGNLDINLDIEMKIRSNRHHIFVEIMRDLEKLKEFEYANGVCHNCKTIIERGNKKNVKVFTHRIK